VTDFGLAKQLTRENAPTLTGSGYLLGTPAYVSPEQAQGAKDVDRRTDVWSMGIMLYEILTGRLPFEGMNALDIVIKTVRDPIQLPSTTRRATLAATDKALERICMRALCKSPDERYQSAEAMADDLTRWLQGRRVLASLPRQSKRPWMIAAACSAVVLLTVLLGMLLSPSAEDPEVKEQRVAAYIAQGKKLLGQNRPTDALVAFGHALEDEPKNKAALAGRKEAEAKIIASAKPDPAPPALPDIVAIPGELTPLRGHASGVHLVAFSGDGKTLITGSYDNSIRLWDFASRSQKKILVEAKVFPVSAAVARQGGWIAAGFLDGICRVWDAEGNPRPPMEGHALQVTGLAFTPDGSGLASSSVDGIARLWDRAAAAVKSSREGFPKGAMCLSLSRDGKMAAVGAAERQIRILDLPSMEERLTFDRVHETEVRCTAFSPDGARIASGGNDGHVSVIELESGRRKLLTGHTRTVIGIAFSPDGQWIASASHDGTLRRWDARTGAPLGSIKAPMGVMAVTFSPDGRLMAAGVGDGTVRFWNVETLTALK
jgi:WD40 repeat protein